MTRLRPCPGQPQRAEPEEPPVITIDERITVPASPDTVWSIMSDPHQVVGCMPGAALGEEHEDGSFDGSLAIPFGPLKIRFKARIRLDLDDRGADRHARRDRNRGTWRNPDPDHGQLRARRGRTRQHPGHVERSHRDQGRNGGADRGWRRLGDPAHDRPVRGLPHREGSRARRQRPRLRPDRAASSRWPFIFPVATVDRVRRG